MRILMLELQRKHICRFSYDFYIFDNGIITQFICRQFLWQKPFSKRIYVLCSLQYILQSPRISIRLSHILGLYPCQYWPEQRA